MRYTVRLLSDVVHTQKLVCAPALAVQAVVISLNRFMAPVDDTVTAQHKSWYVPSSRYIWSLAPKFCFCKNK